jgi:eukaryotic-like serine/threonine-protein kinase
MFPRPFGKYVLERELSRGGMATVFLATLRGTDGFEKKLVVKQIRDELAGDPAFIERFVTEAKTAVRLNHPNIVPVFELGVELGVYFIAMELVRGVSVAELIDRAKSDGEQAFTAAQGAHLGAELCRALDYAHRTAHVIHRDVTPRNVMIDEEGQVKVIDFGIASKALAIGQGIFGSPGHMPPEQMRGEPLDSRADLFAVAVLLMEAWTGKPPFRRKEQAACDAAMQADAPKPSDHDIALAPLDDIVLRAMMRDREARPESADEMARVFRKYLQPFDSSDIERDLGARVIAHLNVRASMQAPPLDDDAGSALSVRKMTTATFAERSLQASQDIGPSTRKIVEPLPLPPAEAARLPKEQPRAALKVVLPLLALGLLGAFVVQGAKSQQVAASVVSVPIAPASIPIIPASANVVIVPSLTTSAPPTVSVPRAVPAPTPALIRTVSTASATSSTALARARLSLLCGAGTQVFVDGAARGKCPVRGLDVAAGSHDVRFLFEPTGESRGERISLAPGDAATLRADFTAAVPVINVSRP